MILLFAILILLGNLIFRPIERIKIHSSLYDPVQTIDVNNLEFRDLNKNGLIDIYEDHRLSSKLRAEDLIARMTLEEKVGQIFHPPFTVKPDIWMLIYEIAIRGNQLIESQIIRKNITHFNLYGNPSPYQLASRINTLQTIASRSRLGIPLTISSDPIHEVPKGGGIASFSLDGFSQWPSQLGLAATRDADLVREFANIARKEYLAVGIRTALHPMADLATDPRWARNFGTFGSNNKLSTDLTLAYMDGFQGQEINSKSVITMVKHFPGGGPQEDGLDPHLYSGRNQVYPGNMFDYHLEPFLKSIENNLKVIMPYYGIVKAEDSENVAIGFNKNIIEELLRKELGFEGVICSDWGIIHGRHWGVEDLSVPQRYQKAINAGIDQFGGEIDTEIVVQLVRNRSISEKRIEDSVKRILINKFDLGLFDNPYVDLENIDRLVNTENSKKLALNAQRKSIVMLKNENILPLKSNTKIYVDGLDRNKLESMGIHVDSIEESEVIIVYLHTVFNGNQPPGLDRTFDKFLSKYFPNQDLNFNDKTLKKIQSYSKDKPVILVVDLNRPAILKELNIMSSALIGTFGVLDEVIYEVIFGITNPTGKLPFEIPSSMEEVDLQLEDVPDDTINPTYKYGDGISF